MMGGLVGSATADETCQSPFLPKVTGQGGLHLRLDAGIKGVADGNDSIVTVDANPSRRATARSSTGVRAGRHEPSRGFTDDRRFLWAAPRHEPDLHLRRRSNPAQPRLVKRISTFVKDTAGSSARTPSTRSPGACSSRPSPMPRTARGARGSRVQQ